jgi:nitrate reductase gamma subunit
MFYSFIRHMNFVLQMSGATASGTISPETAAQLGLMLGGFAAFACLFGIALLTLMIVSRRKIFEKAGLPGW